MTHPLLRRLRRPWAETHLLRLTLHTLASCSLQYPAAAADCAASQIGPGAALSNRLVPNRVALTPAPIKPLLLAPSSCPPAETVGYALMACVMSWRRVPPFQMSCRALLKLRDMSLVTKVAHSSSMASTTSLTSTCMQVCGAGREVSMYPTMFKETLCRHPPYASWQQPPVDLPASNSHM
jgi:hypothetical protein